MQKFFSLISVVLFLSLLSVLPVLADPFSDVPQGHWAYDAVQMLEEKGLVEGYPDGLFKRSQHIYPWQSL
ncbi:MAG: S-layer homology domain-containing protein [Candidatus Eremiobacterota bacterium]